MDAQSTQVEDFDEDDPQEEESTNTWEQPLERTWEQVQEDEYGEIKDQELEEQRARKKRIERLQDQQSVQKGVIRYLYLVVDKSNAMKVDDIKPTRFRGTMELIEVFLKDFFDQNPISQVGAIISHNKRADKVTELSGNPQQQIFNLKNHPRSGGEFSLQNSLQSALDTLKQTPTYGSREILVLMGSLGTCDPGDINVTIEDLKKNRVRCSVISMSAELFVCKNLTQRTAGTYNVAMNKRHYQQLLAQHVPPHSVQKEQSSAVKQWVRMGFPQRRADNYPSLCACHNRFDYGGYYCPKCKTKFCELPTDCQVCQLTLVSSPHLARSYHHLFPVPPFRELSPTDPTRSDHCYACLRTLTPTHDVISQCPRCSLQFCVECDIYIHSSLHNCPGCGSTKS